MSREPFLARWSRRKLSQGDDPAEPASPVVAEDEDPAEPASPGASENPAARPALPPLDSINLDTGVAALFRPEVEEGLRRQALKKLFSDPHFKVMDGLDVYIDDYSRPDPLPPEILDRLAQAQTLLRSEDAGAAKAGEIQPQPDSPPADMEDPPQTAV